MLHWARLLWNRFIAKNPKKAKAIPKVFPRAAHSISQRAISRNALRVLYTLYEGGYEAFLVGGAVRDLLLGKQPKDFDIATNAHLTQIKKLFKNSRIIGHRFKLVHVWFYKEVIEISTFRAPPQEGQRAISSEGMLIRDNTYGNLEQDAMRRDFTINALYYNIADASLLDYHDGWSDLIQRQLRLIGEPVVRYREDPVRILRAIRFAAKHQFTLAETTSAAIPHTAHHLTQVAPARLFEEILKLFLSGYAQSVYPLLCHYGVLPILFPMLPKLNDSLAGLHGILVEDFLQALCIDLDQHYEIAQRSVQIIVLWSGLLWLCFRKLQDQPSSQHQDLHLQTWNLLLQQILDVQRRVIALPKRYSNTVSLICQQTQYALNRSDAKQKRRSSRGLSPAVSSILKFFRQRANMLETHSQRSSKNIG